MSKVSKVFASLALVLVGAVAMAATPLPSPKRTTPMQEFAFIFRVGPAVAVADLARRNSAARDWALALRREGKLSVASPLEDVGFTVTQKSVAPIGASPAIASVLVVRADDLDSAVTLAKGHPGLSYGTQIEVRPVKGVALPTLQP